MVFLGILLPVAVRGVLIANRIAEVAAKKRVATYLGDLLLTERVVCDDWLDSEREGDFGEEWPGYTWRLEDTQWDADDDALSLLCAEVCFTVQGAEHSLRLCTLASNGDGDSE